MQGINDFMMNGMTGLLLAQTAPSAQIDSVWDLIVKGGPVMVPIGLCSLAALTLTVERLISLRRGFVVPQDLLGEVTPFLHRESRNIADALAACKRNGSPLANVLAVAIKRIDQPAETIERHVEEAGEREVVRLRKHFRMLSVIASVAPLLGLLGTITGMITAFQTVAAAGEALGRTELLAKGIYEAMVTTAAGLIVAIPTLLAYHWISARVDHLVAEIDALTVEFIENHASPSGPSTPDRPSTRRIELVTESSVRGDGRVPSAVAAA